MSSAAPFPVQGDTFDTSDDFKRAVYSYARRSFDEPRAGERSLTSLISPHCCCTVDAKTRITMTHSEPGKYLSLACPLATTGAERCSHRVRCWRVKGSQQEQYRITSSTRAHSCGKERLYVNKVRATTDNQARLDALVSAQGSSNTGTSRRRRSSRDETSEESEVESDEEYAMALDAATGTPNWSEVYPPAKELQNEISTLKKVQFFYLPPMDCQVTSALIIAERHPLLPFFDRNFPLRPRPPHHAPRCREPSWIHPIPRTAHHYQSSSDALLSEPLAVRSDDSLLGVSGDC